MVSIHGLATLAMKHKVWSTIAIGAVSILVAYIDYLVPQEVPIDILYLVPIWFATYVFGLRGALAFSTVSLLLFIFSNYWLLRQFFVNRQEFWFAILLTGILLYGLSWGSYIFKLNQARLHKARLALEKQVTELNTLYQSSQNLVEQGLSDTVRLIEQLVVNIGEATAVQQVQLKLGCLPEFEELIHYFDSATSVSPVSSVSQNANIALVSFPLTVNGEEYGKLYLKGYGNGNASADYQHLFAADSSSIPFSKGLLPVAGEQSPLVQALIRHLALALQNYFLHQQSLQLAIIGERNRLAREMHDVLAQGFTGIIFQAQVAAMDCHDSQAVRQRLAQIEQLARYNLQEARRSVANLRPLPLDSQNLMEALQHQVKVFTRENRGIEASFETNGTQRQLPAEVENSLYRISQEALNNVVRHAHANKVKLAVDFDEDELCLTISDDGCGFELGVTIVQSKDDRRKFGLATMHERAKLIGGLLTLESELRVDDEGDAKGRSNLATTTNTFDINALKSGSRVRVIVPYDKMKILH